MILNKLDLHSLHRVQTATKKAIRVIRAKSFVCPNPPNRSKYLVRLIPRTRRLQLETFSVPYWHAVLVTGPLPAATPILDAPSPGPGRCSTRPSGTQAPSWLGFGQVQPVQEGWWWSPPLRLAALQLRHLQHQQGQQEEPRGGDGTAVGPQTPQVVLSEWLLRFLRAQEKRHLGPMLNVPPLQSAWSRPPRA